MGCYGSYKAIGHKLPVGTIVTLVLTNERKFDEYSRECIVVQIEGEIGYVLMADLEPVQ